MLSTHSLLVFAVGVTLYAGVFHGAFARHMRASRWLVGWALSATGFLVARLAQLSTDDPAHALLAARSYAALSPIMVWLLFRFVSELTGEQVSPRVRRGLLAAAIAFAAVSLVSSWAVIDRIDERADYFGHPYLGLQGGPGIVLVGIASYAALGWSLGALARTKELTRSEARALGAAIIVYALMAAESVLSSLSIVPWPGVVEFAPLAIVIGTSHLIANRERRLEHDLEATIDAQTASLRASEERYRSLVDHAPLGIVVCDQAGNVLTMTDRFRQIFEIPVERGSDPRNLLRDAPAQAAGEIRRFARALETGQPAVSEMPYVTRSGRRVDLRFVIAPQRTAGGEPDGALILVEDVTRRRAVEARLRQALKLEAIGQLASGIARGVTLPMAEVRENLAALEHGIEALRKGAPYGPDEAARFAEIEELLGESREGVERAIAIVRDMREISQGGSLAREPVDLAELLGGVVRMAATQRRGEAGIVEHHGRPPRVLGNAGQLRQVLLNLVVNALQAAGAQGVVEVETASARGGACVRVRDDGPGIAAEHRDRIFEPFFTTKPAGEGTGLGLFLSYQIVQSHGGEIRVESQPGEGATFEVWLPAAPASAEVAA